MPNLLQLAREVRDNAYSPYSNFRVGAAVLCENGEIFTGCNVENASLGLTICAERNAIAKMIASGNRAPVAVAIVGDITPCTPCGACRQVLAEFNPDMKVILETTDGEAVFNLRELLPFSFTLEGR